MVVRDSRRGLRLIIGLTFINVAILAFILLNAFGVITVGSSSPAPAVCAATDATGTPVSTSTPAVATKVPGALTATADDPAVATSVSTTTSGSTVPVVLTLGVVHADDTATLGTWYALDEPQVYTAPIPGSYTLDSVDADGRLLDRVSFGLSFTYQGLELKSVPFNFPIPYKAGTAKVVLRHNDVILAEKPVSPNPPTVRLLAPQAGETIKGTYVVKWEGSDPDAGDTVGYIVGFSSDDGATWIPMGPLITATSLELDTTDIGANDRCRVRVLATDGFHATQVVSERFSVQP